MIRIGAPSSDPVGCAIESTCKNRRRRISIRAWHPLVNIPARHWTIEEFAHELGLIIPPRKRPAKPRSFPAARGAARLAELSRDATSEMMLV